MRGLQLLSEQFATVFTEGKMLMNCLNKPWSERAMDFFLAEEGGG
jgi:hypothetical protein